MKRVLILLFICLAANAHAARFLFDADHGQSAANADWVIDADLHNLSWTSAGTFTTSSGNESNAQRIPTPPASGITSNTPETYWSGAISAWAVDLVKRGHSVETLPAGTTLTWNTSNVQDLTNYDVVIIDEPNILFALTEKQALLNFVQHGGSLFMISDHAVSDRNGDGQDSVSIWNDFLTNNGLTNNPFGITFRSTGTGSNSSGVNTFNHNIVGDPILNGPIGLATNVAYFNGNEFQIDNTQNPTVVSRMWFGAQSDSNNFSALATLQYGSGRVVVTGDSSPIDDGSGDPNDSSIINGYTGDAGGVQHIWIVNASEWLAAGAVAPSGPTNSWISGAGKWETGGNWLNALAPSVANSMDLITNTGNKTVTIDATTVLSNVVNGCLTISNLIVSAPANSTNTLFLNNAGVATSLTILSNLSLGANAALVVTNSSLLVSNGLTVVGSNGVGQLTILNGFWSARDVAVGYAVNSSQGTLTIAGGTNVFSSKLSAGGGPDGLGQAGTGTVWMTGGQLIATNDLTYLGYGFQGSGQMIISNGTWTPLGIVVGYTPNSQGTLTIAGGTINMGAFGLSVSVDNQNSSGTVWMTGGQLNGDATIGSGNNGQMTVSNGVWQGDGMAVDQGGTLISGTTTNIHGSGTLTIAGGTITMTGDLDLSFQRGTTGTVWMTGGNLTLGFATDLGVAGVGRMTVSNGSWQSFITQLGEFTGAQGFLTIAGGMNSMYSRLTLGLSDCTATGTVTVVGGSLFVTNASGNAVLDIESGTFTLNSGTVIVDRFVMTNACAHFVRTGGTLIYGSAVLNPAADTDGDGIPNAYELAHGLDPLNPADAGADNDGDGFSNLQEYLAGTDPNSAASTPFVATGPVQQGNDIVLNWTTLGGTTNQVQVTGGNGNGSYATNGFVNLSPQIIIGGSGLVSTNYTDIGGATNRPSRFYRVRLVP